MGSYIVVAFYPNGAKWEGGPYSSSELTWCVFNDINAENKYCLRGYIYNTITKRRVATYGMPLDE